MGKRYASQARNELRAAEKKRRRRERRERRASIPPQLVDDGSIGSFCLHGTRVDLIAWHSTSKTPSLEPIGFLREVFRQLVGHSPTIVKGDNSYKVVVKGGQTYEFLEGVKYTPRLEGGKLHLL